MTVLSVQLVAIGRNNGEQIAVPKMWRSIMARKSRLWGSPEMLVWPDQVHRTSGGWDHYNEAGGSSFSNYLAYHWYQAKQMCIGSSPQSSTSLSHTRNSKVSRVTVEGDGIVISNVNGSGISRESRRKKRVGRGFKLEVNMHCRENAECKPRRLRSWL